MTYCVTYRRLRERSTYKIEAEQTDDTLIGFEVSWRITRYIDWNLLALISVSRLRAVLFAPIMADA